MRSWRKRFEMVAQTLLVAGGDDHFAAAPFPRTQPSRKAGDISGTGRLSRSGRAFVSEDRVGIGNRKTGEECLKQ